MGILCARPQSQHMNGALSDHPENVAFDAIKNNNPELLKYCLTLLRDCKCATKQSGISHYSREVSSCAQPPAKTRRLRKRHRSIERPIAISYTVPGYVRERRRWRGNGPQGTSETVRMDMLQYAITQYNVECLQVLLEHGMNVYPTMDNYTCVKLGPSLHLAMYMYSRCHGDGFQMTRLLLRLVCFDV